jgi:dienelactone hydrolase
MRLARLAIALLGSLLATATAMAQCAPTQGGNARLVELRKDLYTVQGPLAGFDPCNRSVDLRIPTKADKPPLVILVHGGGGGRDNTNTMAAFHMAGAAVLSFDAYVMNGFEHPWRFWLLNMTYEARQRMIYTVALSAYRWATTSELIDPRRIHFYGISNGADVVANLAAAADPEYVRAAFAEGLAGAGLGLPDQLRVPLRAIFGRLDNFGGRTADDWRWQRRNACAQNAAEFERPPGNAANCNALAGARGLTQSPGDWLTGQQKLGADVQVWFYERAAHGIFLGPLQERTNVWAGGFVGYASIGADADIRTQLLDDVMKIVLSP